jgi:hypothetical protein
MIVEISDPVVFAWRGPGLDLEIPYLEIQASFLLIGKSMEIFASPFIRAADQAFYPNRTEQGPLRI